MVALAKKGIYILGFRSMEKRDEILKGPTSFFDNNKPLVVKPWISDIDMCKDNLKTLPTQIQLTLDFKYQGDACLDNIVSSVGKMIKVDHATSK